MKHTDVYVCYFLIYGCKIKASALTMGLLIGVLCTIFCIITHVYKSSVVSSLSFSKVDQELKH